MRTPGPRGHVVKARVRKRQPVDPQKGECMRPTSLPSHRALWSGPLPQDGSRAQTRQGRQGWAGSKSDRVGQPVPEALRDHHTVSCPPTYTDRETMAQEGSHLSEVSVRSVPLFWAGGPTL